MLDLFPIKLSLPEMGKKGGSIPNDEEIETARKHVYSILHKNEKDFHEYIGLDLFIKWNLLLHYTEYAYFLDDGESDELLDFLPDAIHVLFSLTDDDLPDVISVHINQVHPTITKITDLSNGLGWNEWLKIRNESYGRSPKHYGLSFNQKMRSFLENLQKLSHSKLLKHNQEGKLIEVIDSGMYKLLIHLQNEFLRIGEGLHKKIDRVYAVRRGENFREMVMDLFSEDVPLIKIHIPKIITQELIQIGSNF